MTEKILDESKDGLEVRGLHKSYGGLHVTQDVSFKLKPGDRTALIGPNGAGKSTFANLLTGIIKPSSGKILLNGKMINDLNEASRVKLGIAKTFQITTLFRRLTIRENLRLPILERLNRTFSFFGAADRHTDVEQEIDVLIEKFNLGDLEDREVETLAYGQQRLVELALTLALKPRILILDEPAAGVPTSESHLIIEAIEGIPDHISLLIIEHDMNLVFKISKSIIVLVNGEILTEGTPIEISNNEQVKKLYLGDSHG